MAGGSPKKTAVNLDRLFDRELEGKFGTLVIKQAEYGDVGCVVWDAAIVLTKYLETDGFIRKADVTSTDLAEFVPLIELNRKTNKHLIAGTFSASTLKWGEDVSEFLPPLDYVFIADCIYYEQSLEPLIKTMCNLSGSQTFVFLSYEERRTGNKLVLENRFFELTKKHFEVEEIPQDEQDSLYHSEDIHVLSLTKKSP